MKKKFKKIVSKFFPGGIYKEYIKFYYYNIFKRSGSSFSLLKKNGILIYKTTFEQIEIYTQEALYFVAPDFNFYQNYYKVKTNDIILDAGANCGHLTILFSKLVEEKGFIYAFEPDKFNVNRINSNILLNDGINNIKIEELLLWNENKLIDFNEEGSVASSAIWFPETSKMVKKQAIKIDDWVLNNNISKLDFIKMDIEGAEIKALDGCINTIETLSPNFAIASYHIVDGEPTYKKVESFFSKINYPYKTVRFGTSEIITFAGKSINN